MALYEQVVYDTEGQPLTGSFMDYLLPTAQEVPRIEIGHVETPSPFTEYGVKGGGEGGRMIAPAALASAVEDALAPLGVRDRRAADDAGAAGDAGGGGAGRPLKGRSGPRSTLARRVEPCVEQAMATMESGTTGYDRASQRLWGFSVASTG